MPCVDIRERDEGDDTRHRLGLGMPRQVGRARRTPVEHDRWIPATSTVILPLSLLLSRFFLHIILDSIHETIRIASEIISSVSLTLLAKSLVALWVLLSPAGARWFLTMPAPYLACIWLAIGWCDIREMQYAPSVKPLAIT